MARVARVEAFAPDEFATIHVMNRVVRRCFLMGIDELTRHCDGKVFEQTLADTLVWMWRGYHAE